MKSNLYDSFTCLSHFRGGPNRQPSHINFACWILGSKLGAPQWVQQLLKLWYLILFCLFLTDLGAPLSGYFLVCFQANIWVNLLIFVWWCLGGFLEDFRAAAWLSWGFLRRANVPTSSQTTTCNWHFQKLTWSLCELSWTHSGAQLCSFSDVLEPKESEMDSRMWRSIDSLFCYHY